MLCVPNIAINIVSLFLIIGIVGLLAYKQQRDSKLQDYSRNIHDFPKNLTFNEKVKHQMDHCTNKYKDVLYLDNANEPIISDILIENFSKILHNQLLGNPHSESPSSDLATNHVDDVRRDLLKYFGASFATHSIIFAYSDSHAMKILAESFNFTRNSTFIYSSSSNANILGLRDYALKNHSKLKMVNLEDYKEQKVLNITRPCPVNLSKHKNLFAFPLVDSFTGKVVSEKQMKSILGQEYDDGFTVILADASLYLQTNRLNLTELPFHGIVFSFDKWFGFPNIAAIILDNSMFCHMGRPYFSGGTLIYALTEGDFYKFRLAPHEQYEDGSIPFYQIASIKNTMSFMNNLGVDNVHNHIKALCDKLKDKLVNLKHDDGSEVVNIYGSNQHSILTFNIIKSNGNQVPAGDVVEAAAKDNIYVVSGCHSTPGTCYKELGIEESKIKQMIDEGRDPQISRIGAVRVSLGWATTEQQINQLVDWIKSYAK